MVKLLRRMLILLIVTAYAGATMLQVTPAYAASMANTSTPMHGMMHEPNAHGDSQMPCKDMPSGCMSDFGCLFLLSLPSPDLTPVTVTAWASVVYDDISVSLHGRTIPPVLGPPIPLA